MKAPHVSASSQAPRLGLFQTNGRRDASQVTPDLVDDQQEVVKDNVQLDGKGGEGVQDVGICLKEATSAMSLTEMKVAELAREAAEARFDSEDAQARHLEAQTKVQGTPRFNWCAYCRHIYNNLGVAGHSASVMFQW